MGNIRYKHTVSFIIPLHNEESIFMAQINKLNKIIRKLEINDYEIILIENGSTDNTYQLAKKTCLIDKNIILIESVPSHYGQAIKKGLETAVNELVIQLDLDLIDYKFIKKAINSTDDFDILIGSKFLSKKDNRSIFRKILSYGLKKVINIIFGYRGTDTHGIKAYKMEEIEKLVQKLPMTKHMFDTSIVIEAKNIGLKVVETPISIHEIRPSRFPLTKRIFEAMFDIFILFKFKLNNLYRIKLKFTIPFI
ncbi:MAG: glycosyltransferase family 2 protein [Candidatus Microgenomates bacterium]